jgi:hypothetical protein
MAATLVHVDQEKDSELEERQHHREICKKETEIAKERGNGKRKDEAARLKIRIGGPRQAIQRNSEDAGVVGWDPELA